MLHHPSTEGLRDPSTGRFGETIVSIVRVGLAETKNFAEGFDAIFGRKKSVGPKKKSKKTKAKKRSGRKK